VDHERAVVPTLKQSGEIRYYDIPALIADTTNTVVLIAEIAGEPVGCGLGTIKENDACYNEMRYGYIGLMYVDEAYRGKNIAGEIVQKIVQWFRDRSISEIRLKVYASNSGAVRAYRKYGFEDYIFEMKLQNPHL